MGGTPQSMTHEAQENVNPSQETYFLVGKKCASLKPLAQLFAFWGFIKKPCLGKRPNYVFKTLIRSVGKLGCSSILVIYFIEYLKFR